MALGLMLLSCSTDEPKTTNGATSSSSVADGAALHEWKKDIVWDEIKDSYFVLSDDGKTLVKWEDESIKHLDMNRHPRLKNVEIIGKKAFEHSTLHSIIVGQNVHTLGGHCFEEMDYLEHIDLASVRVVERFVFDRCPQLTELHLPGTIERLDETFLPRGCYKLERLTIPDNHPSYKVVDNVLFDKAMKMLIQMPQGKKAQVYEVPEGIEQIGMMAFYHIKYIDRLIFPESLRQVRSRSLDGHQYHGEPREYILEIIFKSNRVVEVLADEDAREPELSIYEKVRISVPKHLVDTYKHHKDWAHLAAQIFPIE